MAGLIGTGRYRYLVHFYISGNRYLSPPRNPVSPHMKRRKVTGEDVHVSAACVPPATVFCNWHVFLLPRRLAYWGPEEEERGLCLTNRLCLLLKRSACVCVCVAWRFAAKGDDPRRCCGNALQQVGPPQNWPKAEARAELHPPQPYVIFPPLQVKNSTAIYQWQCHIP